MVDQANSSDVPERTPPEFGTLRAVDEAPSEDFVAAVERRAALKGDVAGRTINWRLRRRLKRFAGAVVGLAVVVAIAAGAYFYREDGGDPLSDSVTAVGSAADTVETWIDEQTTAISNDGAGTSSGTVVDQADQEVLAYNAGTSSQETTPEAASGTTLADSVNADADGAANDSAVAEDADSSNVATEEPGVAGADTLESQAADIAPAEPDVETVDALAADTPDITAPSEAGDVVDSSDIADMASTAESLAADDLPESNVAATDAAENDAVETEPVEIEAVETEAVETEPAATAPETQTSDAASSETPDVADAVVPTPEAPPSSDDGLTDESTPDVADAAADTALDDVPVPPLPAENIADIETALPDETVSDETPADEPVEVAEVTEPVVPVAELPVVSAYSHAGTRVELADYGTAEQAQEGWRELKSELGGVVGDHNPVIEEGSAGAGLIYRVQIGYFDSAFAAANFCTAVMDRKVTCTVIPQ
ncbi:MAG: hypothetical protein AAF563_20395 [Pseudomonadota bacterium]